MVIFIGLLLFQLGMYTFIYFANQDANFNQVGTADSREIGFGNVSTNTDVDINDASLLDGFKISVFGLPSWFNFIYVSILIGLNFISGYGLIRGL